MPRKLPSLLSIFCIAIALHACGGSGGGSGSEAVSPGTSNESGNGGTLPPEGDTNTVDDQFPLPEPGSPTSCPDAQQTLTDVVAVRSEIEDAIRAKSLEIANEEERIATCEQPETSNGGTGNDVGDSSSEGPVEDKTYLPELKGIDKYQNYPMPAYRSPEHAWQMIEAECGPVGNWDHEIEVHYSNTASEPDLRIKNLDGCVHVRGIPGPNGELPRIIPGSTRGYRGQVSPGGVFIENIAASAVGVPNNKKFLVLHNVHLSEWGGHALITSAGAKHLYLEVKDSYAGGGNSNHAMYIDNIAYANIQGNVFEAPGQGHALRVIAQRSRIIDNVVCNIRCDGTIDVDQKGRERIGMAPLEIYVNGEHYLEDNRVVYRREHSNATPMAATFRWREAINTLDRLPNGDEYNYLIWGTDEYNDPATWAGPMLETVIKDMVIECLGEHPCYGWHLQSTYPFMNDSGKAALLAWWKENAFDTWDQLLANSHPSWHGTLNLMTEDYREEKLAAGGRGLPNKIPLPVPEGWQQKARVIFDNVTGNFEVLVRPETSSPWCAGAMENNQCVNPDYYRTPEIVER